MIVLTVHDVVAGDEAGTDAIIANADFGDILHVLDVDPVVFLGGRQDMQGKVWGVWLDGYEGYPPQLMARDIKTLSHLIALDTVIVSCEGPAKAYAEVVERLLTNDVVTFTNEAATLTNAVNRPAPRRPITVWYREGMLLISGPHVVSMTLHQPGYSVYEADH